jgi:hypothetical protein
LELGIAADEPSFPVEKLVELKTLFEIPFRKDRTVGFGEPAMSPLKP